MALARGARLVNLGARPRASRSLIPQRRHAFTLVADASPPAPRGRSVWRPAPARRLVGFSGIPFIDRGQIEEIL
jgi:hypothetical protein